MTTSRRAILKAASVLPMAWQLGRAEHGEVQAAERTTAIGRIATEEAMAIPEIFEEWRLRGDLGAETATWKDAYVRNRLLDIGEERISEMDASGISMQVLSLAAPGVQIFESAKAVDLAKKTNDRLAEVVRTHPDRFAALAAVAPQNPPEAARELKRAVQTLGLKGALINSHTNGEYLDERKFWPILEMAQALDVPIYLHPRTPSPQMIQPYLKYGLQSFAWGFAAETGLHALRLIFGGVFDEFPRLKIILGHMGEGIPFWLKRIDKLAFSPAWAEGGAVQKMKKLPSDYFKDNFFVTTSGMPWHPAFMLVFEVLGPERILFAVDYPFESGREAVELLETAPIERSDKEKIFQRNAEKLLRISKSA